jgi:predicted dehydrogenase
MSIRVGILGLNHGAQVHLPALKTNPRYEVLAVCARTPGRAEAVAQANGVPRWYTDPRQLLASALDLVVVATPPPTHAGYAAMALAAGKHVLVEVGYTASAADARVLAGLARERGRVGVVALSLRFSPTIRHVGDVLSQGGLGEPRLMQMDLYNSYLAEHPNDFPWLWSAGRGGGVLANYLVHGLDLARLWFGPVERVAATLAARAAPAPPRAARRTGAGLLAARAAEPAAPLADDTGAVTLYFANGMLATFSYSAVVALRRTQINLHGALASLLVQGLGDECELLNLGEEKSRSLFPPTHYLEETRGQVGLLGGLPVLLERLADAIGGAPAPDLPMLDEALELQRLLDAAQRSAAEQRQVLIAEV